MLKYNSNYQNIENMNNYELFEPFMILNNIYNIIYIGRNNFNYSQLIFSDINFILNKHFIILLPEIFSIFSLFLLVILIVFYYIKVSNLSIIDINFSILLINLFTFYFYLQIFSYKTLFAFNFLFIVDFYSIFNKLILLFSTNIILLLILIISIFNKKIFAHNRYEYTIIIGFSTIASSLLISSFDLILLYLALECLSFCLYILVLFKIKNKLSAEAGVKYFCLGSLASGFVLFGISLIYANICSTNFLIIKYWFKLNNSNNEFQLLSIYIGVIFIMFGFLFKLAVFPFHMGLLDIYDGSTLSVTIYLITVIKFVIVIVFCKLFIYVFYAIQIIWSPILSISSIISMFWGSIGALYQENIKKFFAYSSLHQIGYIILSLSTGSSLGLLSALMYIFIYMFTGIAFFSLILLTTYYIKYSSKKCKLIYLNNLALINKIEPALAFIFILILFSLANLPPFTGFFVKLYIFKSIVNCTYSYIWWLALPALMTSILSSFYYLRLVKIILFEKLNIQSLNKIIFNIILKNKNKSNLYKNNFAYLLIKYLIIFILITIVLFLCIFCFFSNKILYLFENLSFSCIAPMSFFEYLLLSKFYIYD